MLDNVLFPLQRIGCVYQTANDGGTDALATIIPQGDIRGLHYSLVNRDAHSVTAIAA